MCECEFKKFKNEKKWKSFMFKHFSFKNHLVHAHSPTLVVLVELLDDKPSGHFPWQILQEV